MIAPPSIMSTTAAPSSAESGCFCNPFARKSTKENQPIEEAERIISEGLMGVSLKEREEAIQDIHGVYETKQEDHSLLLSCCNELDYHLSQKMQRTKALQMARSYNNGAYVRSLYLMFLRCDDFNPSKAANRLEQHFEIKRELFLNACLVRDITLDDFHKDDMSCLKLGAYQVLPTRDRAGRPILVCCFFAQKYKEPANLVSALVFCFAIELFMPLAAYVVISSNSLVESALVLL